MKELKILAVVIFFSFAVYYGVEPFAHSQMHKHVDSKNYAYSDLPAITKKGDAAKGAETFVNAGCIGCHGLKVAGFNAPMDPSNAAASFGVSPPDLSSSGLLYNENFLAALIKNPTHALKVEHKFDEAKGKLHPMTKFYGLGGDIDQEVADIVAYLKSVAPSEITPKDAYADACGRCHAMRYAKWTQLGDTPKFKWEKDEFAHLIKVKEYEEHLKKYMGKLPPDLSIMIRARSEKFIRTFTENPQAQIPGTSMPRVGLTEEGVEKVMEYMGEIGDPSKPKRESLGPKVLIYLVIFTFFAYLWKKSMWRDLH